MRKREAFYLSLLLAVALPLSAVTPVAAQDAAASASPDEAQTAFLEARALYDGGKFAEAAKRFREAYEAKPAWKLLYNIGQSEAAAKQYGRALSAFELYLAEGGDEVNEKRQQEVRAEIERLRTLVGLLDIAAPKGAEIYVDDFAQGKAPLPGVVPVTAGKTHRVVVRVDGTELPVQEVVVMGGQTKSLRFEAEPQIAEAPESAPPAESAAETPVEVTPVTAEPERSVLVPVGWAVTGTGVAALIAGGVLGGLALKKNGEIEDACPDGECPSEMKSDVDTRDNMGLASTVLFAAGGAIAATGVVLLIVGLKKSKAAESAKVAPLVSPEVAGAQIVWSF